MTKYIIRRAIQAIPVLIGASFRPRASIVAFPPCLRHHVRTREGRWSSLHEQLETLEVTGC